MTQSEPHENTHNQKFQLHIPTNQTPRNRLNRKEKRKINKIGGTHKGFEQPGAGRLKLGRLASAR